MTTYWGPKLSFSMPKKQEEEKEGKKYSQFEMESTNYFKSENKKIKKVEFASSTTIFLLYQTEEIWRFRERLKGEVQQTKEILKLNPTLWDCPTKKAYKSCMKPVLDLDY